MATRQRTTRPQSDQAPRPQPGAQTLADVIVTGPLGRSFTGEDLASLLNLAERHPSVGRLTDYESVNLKLRGLGALCSHAHESPGIGDYADDRLMLWFVAETLTDLAALVESGGEADPTKYVVKDASAEPKAVA